MEITIDLYEESLVINGKKYEEDCPECAKYNGHRTDDQLAALVIKLEKDNNNLMLRNNYLERLLDNSTRKAVSDIWNNDPDNAQIKVDLPPITAATRRAVIND